MDNLIDKYLAPGMHGLDLTWVHDLPVPEKKQAAENEPLAPENSSLLQDLPGTAAVDRNGNVTLNETGPYVSALRAPKASLGQLKGQELNQTHYMDQTELQQELHGSLSGYGEDVNGRPLQMIGTENIYLPKKARLLKDPDIQAELTRQKEQEELEETREREALPASLGQLDKPENLVVEEADVKEEPAAGTFDAYQANRKHQLYQQGPDTAAYIAELYAMNVVRSSPQKREADQAADRKAAQAMELADALDPLRDDPQGQEKRRELQGQLVEMYPHLQSYIDKKSGLFRISGKLLREQIRAGNRTEKERITPSQQKMIEEMSKLALPVVKDMLGSKTESTALPLAAVEEDPRKLVERIDSFAQKQYYIEPNPNNDPQKPDWTEIKQTIDSSMAALRATGTGKNYFGVRREHNSEKYERMMASLEQYQNMLSKGLTPSGMQNRDLTQKLLDYAGDKFAVRSTKDTGQVRFDSVMRVLRQVMPPRQFRQLLGKINQKREARRGDKNFADENTYAPMTAKRYAQMKVQQALTQSGSRYVKLCSEALAARLIGQQQERGDKTLVEDPADPSLKQALEQKAAQLRQDPKFRQALAMIPAGRTAQETLQNRQDWLSNGEGLANLYAMSEPAMDLPQQQSV